MAEDLRLSLGEFRKLATDILVAHDTSASNAAIVASALALAEADGQPGHGAVRIRSYAEQARSGKVDGHATPSTETIHHATVRIDARSGFAYPALQLAVDEAAERALRNGIACVVVANSHHAGVAAHPVESLARKGLLGLLFCNGPVAIAPWGGRKGVFGTNPIAFAAPRSTGDPLVIDMSLSKVARGRINMAATLGQPIPDDWAIGPDGSPTTDPTQALAGTLQPMGGAKGAQLVLMVEILAAALSASRFGYEASSFFHGDGPPPHVGQCLIAIDPGPMSGDQFSHRLDDLLGEITAQPGTRLPGTRRFEHRRDAERNGIVLPAALADDLRALQP